MKRTALYDVHRQAAAKLVSFQGWEMPVEYSGLIAEHMAVRQSAGLFDVSHMGEFEIVGPGALGFLQRVTAGDVAKLLPGRGQYTALPNPNGAPVDDVVLFERDAESFLMIVNAGNIERDLAWLKEQARDGCEIKDVSGELSLLALQGPRAQEILQQITDFDLSAVAYYHFAEGQVAERTATVSRTGYTGEDGFEIMVRDPDAEPLWRRLLAVGDALGVTAIGLGARDTLRLEAKMCLYGSDIDETTTLIEGGLGWLVCLDEAKGDFIGRPVLERQKREGVSRKLVGFEVVGRGIARQGYPIYVGGSEVGQVTSGTYAPYLKKNIGLGYLPIAHSKVGSEFEVGIRERRVGAQVVKTPFYKRPR